MGTLYTVKKGHTVHINVGKHYSEGETFVENDDKLKGQEYKLEKAVLQNNDKFLNRAITQAENR